MSPLLKFAIVFMLGLAGIFLAPRHACHLSSPVLFTCTLLFSLVAVPLCGARAKKSWVTWSAAAAAPFVAFALMFFYMEVLHWEGFPKWLLRDGGPNRVAGGIAPPSSHTTVHAGPRTAVPDSPCGMTQHAFSATVVVAR